MTFSANDIKYKELVGDDQPPAVLDIKQMCRMPKIAVSTTAWASFPSVREYFTCFSNDAKEKIDEAFKQLYEDCEQSSFVDDGSRPSIVACLDPAKRYQFLNSIHEDLKKYLDTVAEKSIARFNPQNVVDCILFHNMWFVMNDNLPPLLSWFVTVFRRILDHFCVGHTIEMEAINEFFNTFTQLYEDPLDFLV